MTIAYVVVTILSIATLTFSVAADLLLADQVKTNMDRAGVPRAWLPTLAALRAAGAIGLAVGFAAPLIGAAAAVGVVAFFTGAIVTHLLAHWYAIGSPATTTARPTAEAPAARTSGSFPPTPVERPRHAPRVVVTEA